MFQEELDAFRHRIRERAKVKVAEMMEQLEAEEREKRLGPGGLDPIEVMESLPPVGVVYNHVYRLLTIFFLLGTPKMLRIARCGTPKDDSLRHGSERR